MEAVELDGRTARQDRVPGGKKKNSSEVFKLLVSHLKLHLTRGPMMTGTDWFVFSLNLPSWKFHCDYYEIY